MVPAEPEELAPYVVLRERVGHASLSLSNQGVIINEKLAELLKIQTGDKITIGTSGETQVLVQVTGITENYAMNYVYMTPTLYQQLYQDTLEYNSVIFHLVEDTEENEGLVTTAMLDSGDYLSVTMLSKTNSSFRDVISILNSVVVVLVLSAAVLGFVVLYNLSAINISERVREIATLKVLGLYPSEVTGYIGRESAILTLIGTILGLLAGMGLHRYIMDTIGSGLCYVW